MSVVSEIMNERPMDDVVSSVFERNYLYNRVRRTARKEDFYGEYAKILMHTSMPMNAAPRLESEAVPMPSKDTFAEQHITQYQMMSSIGWTAEEAEEAVKKGDAAIIDLVNRKVALAPSDMRWKQNMMYGGDGTGRMARVVSESTITHDVSTVVTVDNTQANFGIKGTTLFKRTGGIRVDILRPTASEHMVVDTDTPYVVAWNVVATKLTATTLRVAILTDVEGNAVDGSCIGTHEITNNDFIVLHNSWNLLGAKTVTATPTFKGFNITPGLLAIVDDQAAADDEWNIGVAASNGSWLGPTFQNLARASYPELLATVYRGDTPGTAQSRDVAYIQDCVREIDENSESGGVVTALYMNGVTRDWMTRADAGMKNITIDQNVELIPGIKGATMFRTSGGRTIPIVPINTLGDGVIYGINEGDLILFEGLPLGWHTKAGSRIIDINRNLTYESWMRWKGVLAAERCDNCFRAEDIDTSE